MTILLIGKSAVGKDTTMAELNKHGFKTLVSHTTRPMRDGEIDGVHYHFVNDSQFIDMDLNNEFLQTRTYHTKLNGKNQVWHYGLHKDNLTGTNTISIFDVQGAIDFIKNTTGDVLCFYLMLDDEIRLQRAKARGSFCQVEWDRRLADDEERFNDKSLEALDLIKIDVKNFTTEELVRQILVFVKVRAMIKAME